MMKRIVFFVLVSSLVLAACSSVQPLAQQAASQAGKALETVRISAGQSIEPTSPTPTVSGVSPTCTPSLAPLPTQQTSDSQLRQSLSKVMQSPDWAKQGLPQALAQKWSDFAQGSASLTDPERAVLSDFLAQWKMWSDLANLRVVPADSLPTLRVHSLEGQGTPRLVVYAIDEKASQATGSQRLFLIERVASEQAIGLLLAPRIENLTQQINPDGAYVQYLTQAGKCVLLADARQLDNSRQNEKTLKERLDQIYGDSPYVQASAYPRFRYNITGEAAGFFAIESTLTYNQVIRLQEALDLFNRPEFEPFKPQLFAAGIAYVVVDKIGNAAGLTYSGTGVVELDRRDLFGNRYELASVIAHEGSHVLQGGLNNNPDICQQSLQREIGNGTIPADFYSWDATQLLQAIRDGTIGAYHVSLWSMAKLGLKNLDWVIQAIRSGQVNGQSVVMCQN